MVFGQELKILTLAERIPYKRASQKEQNGVLNEELRARKRI